MGASSGTSRQVPKRMASQIRGGRPVGVRRSTTRGLPSPARDRRLRRFLLGCGAAAIGISAIAQIVAPSRGEPWYAWLVTVLLPGLIVAIALTKRGRRPPLLFVAAVLIYVEAVLLAGLYTVGIAFAILLPIIAIGLVQAYVRGWVKLAAYLGAVVAATLAVVIAELGVPANPLGADTAPLAVAAFSLVAGFALGITWHTGERLLRALDEAKREIDRRIAVENKLRLTAGFLERLIESSPVATMVLEADGHVSVWNPAAEALLGWTADEVIGEEPPIQVPHAASDAAGQSVALETRDGRRVSVEVHAAVRHTEKGEPLGLIVQLIDLTKRAALEAQLRQAQKMEAVGHLAGGIAHDINNTLTAVGGFAELIEAQASDAEVRADAQQIAQAVGRAGDLTRQLLAFARRSVLEPQTFVVSAFIASIVPMLQRLLGTDITMHVEDHAPMAAVHVDPAGFEQALLNLAVNGRDAMPAGGTLTLRTSRRDGNVVVTVSDTGVGIPEEFRDQVFEPFFTTKEQGKGTGLGLSMVYGFVTQSGGTVELRSSASGGTTIEIALAEVPYTKGIEPSAAPAADTHGTETVLFVEDDETVARFGVRVLRRLGYEVLEAPDGDAAIAVAREHTEPIQLILSDVIMPGMMGPEAVRAVQAIHPEAAILFASGYTADAIADRGVLPEGVELLRKPYTAGELADRVRATLDGRTAQAVSRGSNR